MSGIKNQNKVYKIVTCPFGMYVNQTSQDCEPCPLGFYQDQQGQTKCLECPADTSTVILGTETKSGCYGGQEMLTSVTTSALKWDTEKFQEVMANIINEHCNKNVCPMDEEENLQGDTVNKMLMIKPTDVVIPSGYPVTLKTGKKQIRMFVVISFTNYQLKTFPREKLESVLYRNTDKLEKQLTAQAQKDEGNTSKTSSNSPNNLAVKIVVPVSLMVLIVAGCVIVLYRKRRSQESPNREDHDNHELAQVNNSDVVENRTGNRPGQNQEEGDNRNNQYTQLNGRSSLNVPHYVYQGLTSERQRQASQYDEGGPDQQAVRSTYVENRTESRTGSEQQGPYVTAPISLTTNRNQEEDNRNNQYTQLNGRSSLIVSHYVYQGLTSEGQRQASQYDEGGPDRQAVRSTYAP